MLGKRKELHFWCNSNFVILFDLPLFLTDNFCCVQKQKFSHQREGGEIKPFTSIIGATDDSVKVTKGPQVSADHHHNISRAISLRHHRQFYGRHYSRRNSTNNAEASTSHDKAAPSYDEKTSFKLASKYRLDSGSGDHSGMHNYHLPSVGFFVSCSYWQFCVVLKHIQTTSL